MGKIIVNPNSANNLGCHFDVVCFFSTLNHNAMYEFYITLVLVEWVKFIVGVELQKLTMYDISPMTSR